MSSFGVPLLVNRMRHLLADPAYISLKMLSGDLAAIHSNKKNNNNKRDHKYWFVRLDLPKLHMYYFY